jgi:hypothetical protein
VFVKMNKLKRFVMKVKSNKMSSLISVCDTYNMIHILMTAAALFYRSAAIYFRGEEIY